MKKYYKIGTRLIMYIIIWFACITLYNIFNLNKLSGAVIAGILIVLGEVSLDKFFKN